MSNSSSKENGQDTSYSMYPPTSPAAPPANMQYNMNMYGNPATFTQYGYGYPMPMDIYAGQGAPFIGYGMNPNMMYYGGAIPQPGGGQKKKYYNNKSDSANGNKNDASGHQNGHIQYYNTKPSTPSSSTTTPATPASKTVPITIKNQYKFEVGNDDSTLTSESIEYPFYINTTEEEFASARAKRHEITLKVLRKEINRLELDEATALEATEQIVPKNSPIEEEQKKVSMDAMPDAKDITGAETKTKETVQAESTEDEDLKENASPSPSAKAIKSWSAVASSASPKTIAQPSSLHGKKDKKYVPSSVKSLEPLGSVALRMCFDEDYIKYTMSSGVDSALAIQSIVPRGIVNSGNICFMSSILQVLLVCKPFVNVLNVISLRTSAKMGTPVSPLLDACLDIYRKFDKQTFEREKSTKGNSSSSVSVTSFGDAIKPDEFYKALSKLPKFKDLRWGHQEDAEEFLTHLLDQLHEEFITAIDALTDLDIIALIKSLNDDDLKVNFIKNLARYRNAEFAKSASVQLKELLDKYGVSTDDFDEESEDGWHEVSSTSKKGKKTKTAAKRTVEVEPSPISAIFGGQFRSVLDIPQSKESQSITLDPFQTIQLDISDPAVNDLETAFKKFSEPEMISFKASSGNDVEAKKQTFIDKLPQVFLIQLKRFSFINNTDKNKMVNYNAYNGRVEKIRKKVHYQHYLTIPEESISSVHSTFYSSIGTTYRLIGVVYHHGISSSGGHYTCDVYNEEQDKWFRIDDVNITELGKDDVLKGGEDGSDSRTAYILMYEKV